jgi:hypothetical protein
VIATHSPLPLATRSIFPKLDVLTGLHAGATVDLESAVCRIGADVQCTIVLSDPQIQPFHLTLLLDERHLTIEASGGDVMIGDRLLSQGHGCRCRLPVEFRIGETALRLADAAGAERPRWPGRNPCLALGLLGSLLLAACLWLWQASPQPASLAAPANAMAATPVPPGGIADPAARLAQLRDRLDAAGLQALTTALHDDVVAVGGSVDDAQRLRWIEVQNWYDRTWGNQPWLRNEVALVPTPRAPRVHFQAVWLGPQPYVVNERGRRLYPGAALDDGWVLQRIENDRVVLARDGKEFELTL